MIIIKTWANSWATSDRYQEDLRLPCIFGCAQFCCCEPNSKDYLTHYLACPILWNLVDSAINSPVLYAAPLPVQNCCFNNPSQDDLKRLAVAFKSYHAIRLSHPEVVRRALRSKEFESLHKLLLEYIHHFADEFSLRHRAV